jgi:3-phosphoshikimate 1-carboxyvinyltransferase
VVAGDVRVPGDKSLSHRALLFAALADGTSRLRGLQPGEDVASTARVLRALGVDVPALGGEVRLVGRGLRRWRSPDADLDCGNSGTTTRLVAGCVAAHPFAATFTGDASLSKRPMHRIATPLKAMGATVTFHRKKGDGLPMTVQGGALRSVEWRSETASAQVKSAILLAGLHAGVPVTVHEPSLSRDHTERLLAAMGVPVARRGASVTLAPVDRLAPLDLDVPGDPSSAAFLVALAALAPAGSVRVADVCVNATRTGFLDALAAMGADVRVEDARTVGGEPVGALVARGGGRLRGVVVGGERIPAMIDELPLLACVAARAEGETLIRDASELRGKESDRIAAVVANLRAIGVEAEELPDGMRIVGTDAPLAGTVTTHGDHRLAMAFGVLGVASGGRIVVDAPACVAVSYPGFWETLAALTAPPAR